MDHETAEEIKRHFHGVAEGLRSDIRLVIEGLAANTDRLEGVEVRLEGVETGLGGMRTDLGELKATLAPLIPRS